MCPKIGTAAALSPVSSIDYRDEGSPDIKTVTIGNGAASPHFTRMLNELLSLQCGDVAVSSTFSGQASSADAKLYERTLSKRAGRSNHSRDIDGRNNWTHSL